MSSLADVAQAIVDCEHKTAPTQSDGIPLVRTANIKNGRLDLDSANRVSEETYREWTARIEPRGGDLILAREAPVGEIGMVPEDSRVCLGQRTVLIRPNTDKVVPRYLLYLFVTPQVRHELQSRAEGSTTPHLNVGEIRAFGISQLPPLSEQRRIAHILGSLDDKIQLNWRMNRTLEAIARAIFKSWFIEFDPVIDNAILNGKPIPDEFAKRAMIRREILAQSNSVEGVASYRHLFPDEFQDSKLGPIPEGWNVSSLGEVLGAKSERVGDADVPVYSSTNTGLEPRSERFKKRLSASKAKNKLVRKGDLVFGLSRQVLSFGLMRDSIGCVSPAYQVFAVDETEVVPDFLERMMRLRMHYFYGAISASSREGQAISTEGLYRLLVVRPPMASQMEFYAKIEPLLAQAERILVCATTTATLRDTLLPKLISGELRVKDALHIVLEGNI